MNPHELMGDSAVVAHAGDPLQARVCALLVATYYAATYLGPDDVVRPLRGGPSGQSIQSEINSVKCERVDRDRVREE